MNPCPQVQPGDLDAARTSTSNLPLPVACRSFLTECVCGYRPLPSAPSAAPPPFPQTPRVPAPLSAPKVVGQNRLLTTPTVIKVVDQNLLLMNLLLAVPVRIRGR